MINIPKGTKDVLPQEATKWHYIESKIREVTTLRGFREVRTPMFESTELFDRGVGETTDIVNKEMYTFLDKGGRSMTLKPEGTAGVARMYIENGLASDTSPLKMFYETSVFRYEKPQAGRLREHHQFGVEVYGSTSPYSDLEVILTAKALFDAVGIKDLSLRINNIGCDNCRAKYNEAIKKYFTENIDDLCDTCKERLNKNPLRILDCKEEKCKKIVQGVPSILDYLCDDCKNHFNTLQGLLKAVGINFVVDDRIVRGLDYYTGTVFEFTTDTIGAQGTVCGGGRYNNLVSSIGGPKTPAVGFGMGIERLILVAEAQGIRLGETEVPSLYVVNAGAGSEAVKLVENLRSLGISAETDIMDRSVKAQMKYADKRGFKYVIVLGTNELETGKVAIKKMADGSVLESAISDISNNLQ